MRSIGWFVEDDTVTQASYSRLVTLAGLASTATAGVLILAKLSAWLLTGSSSKQPDINQTLDPKRDNSSSHVKSTAWSPRRL